MNNLRESFERWAMSSNNENICRPLYGCFGNVMEYRYSDEAWQAYQAAHNAQQAKIDRLMLEYCPDEITPEQLKEWGRHQRRVKDTVQQSQTVDEWGVESGWVTYTAKEISELKNEPCGYGYRREYREITEGKS